MWTSLRTSEFLELKKRECKSGREYFIIPKGKTINAERKVPIADTILPFFEALYNDSNCEYLYHTGKSRKDKPVSYDQYLKTFRKLMESLGWKYTPHATRHTFTSLLVDLSVSSTLRSKLACHSVGNVTETVYTHLDISVLLVAVNKLECFIK